VKTVSASAGTVYGGGAPQAVTYLKGRQNSDGGFSEPGAASDLTTTSWVLLAGVSTGEKPLNWMSSGADTTEYLLGSAGSVKDFNEIELIALAITKAGGDPRNAAGLDLVSLGKANISESGKIGSDLAEHCRGILFLAAAGESVSAKCTEWLVQQQRQDGGWGESNKVLVQDTALALEALAAAGEQTKKGTDAALKLLQERVNSDGGFKGPSGKSDAQTTSGVVRAVTALGQDPSSKKWSFHGNTPVSFLNSLQAADGHFQYSKGVESQPAVTTAMAATALSGGQSKQKDSDKSTKDKNDGSSPDTSNEPSTTTDADQGSSTPGSLGTEGADIARRSDVSNGTDVGRNVKVGVLDGPSSGAEGSLSGATGLWLFLVICAVYLGMLLVLVAVVGILVRKPEGPADSRTGSQHYPDA
jgi:prenyltransferase beta subunit